MVPSKKNIQSIVINKELQFTCQMLSLLQLFLAFLAIAYLSGCSKRYSDLPAYSPIPIRDYENNSVGRFKTSFLVDQIDGYFKGTAIGPVGVTTFVNLDDLYTTSTFGRMLSEQVMSELAMRGYDILEMRQSDALQFLNNGGEFMLSRDITVIRRERDLSGIVVGTYVVSPDRVYVNARLVDPATSVVLSAGSVEMGKTYEIARMLRGGVYPTSLERIPVRHLGIDQYPMMMPSQVGRMYDMQEMSPTLVVPKLPTDSRQYSRDMGAGKSMSKAKGKGPEFDLK